MNIAILPARSGSKRIKNKNIKLFKGKPIINITIRKLIKSKLFDKIYVSTDSKQIAKIATASGAEVPFLRSKKLSGDFISTQAVIKDTIKKIKINPKFICCIYPTAILISKKELAAGFTKIKKKYKFIFSAYKIDYRIGRSFALDGKKKNLKMLSQNYYDYRTQDLPGFFLDAGQFYWAKTENWLKEKKIFGKQSSIIEIPSWRACDIDTIKDWKAAEKVYEKIKK